MAIMLPMPAIGIRVPGGGPITPKDIARHRFFVTLIRLGLT